MPQLTLALEFTTIPAALLASASAAVSALHTLVIVTSGKRDSLVLFPPPEQMPGLRDVAIRVTCSRIADPGNPAWQAQDAMWRSIAPYLPQLDSLTIEEQDRGLGPLEWPEPNRTWAILFTPATTSNTLTRLSLLYPLMPWLCKLLQQHAKVSDHIARLWHYCEPQHSILFTVAAGRSIIACGVLCCHVLVYAGTQGAADSHGYTRV